MRIKNMRIMLNLIKMHRPLDAKCENSFKLSSFLLQGE